MATTKLRVDRRITRSKRQAADTRGRGKADQIAKGIDAIRQQSLTARLSPRVARLLMEHDPDATASKRNRQGRTRRPTAHDRDVRLHHANVNISAENPGPRAIIRPESPDTGRPEATKSCSMNNTDALD